jgi:hypothetical protein
MGNEMFTKGVDMVPEQASPSRCDSKLVFKVPIEMKTHLRRAADRSMTTASGYARLALKEKLEREGFIPPRAATA